MYGDTETELDVGKRESQDQQRDKTKARMDRLLEEYLKLKSEENQHKKKARPNKKTSAPPPPSPSEMENLDRILGSESDRSVDSTASSDWEPPSPLKLQRTH